MKCNCKKYSTDTVKTESEAILRFGGESDYLFYLTFYFPNV